MITVTPRPRSGIYGESTNDEAYNVLPGEDCLVKDVMTAEVTTATASITVKEALEVVRNRNIPLLIVCRENEPVHALSEYDLAINVAAENRAESVSLHEVIKDRMVLRCREDAILADAIEAMVHHRTRHVPVVDVQGHLVGALSLVDAVGALTPDAAASWQTKVRQLWTEAPEFKGSGRTHPDM